MNTLNKQKTNFKKSIKFDFNKEKQLKTICKVNDQLSIFTNQLFHFI